MNVRDDPDLGNLRIIVVSLEGLGVRRNPQESLFHVVLDGNCNRPLNGLSVVACTAGGLRGNTDDSRFLAATPLEVLGMKRMWSRKGAGVLVQATGGLQGLELQTVGLSEQ